MKITKSTVEKLTITGVPNQDAISVILEDFGPGAGKITITCFNDCWTNYWGAMGKGNTITSFFSNCSNDYIIGKFKSCLSREIDHDDEEELTTALRKKIIEYRRDETFDKEQARDLFDRSYDPMGYNGDVDSELFYDVFGDEWWYCKPKKPNPEYEYLCRIIDTVKEALKGYQKC